MPPQFLTPCPVDISQQSRHVPNKYPFIPDPITMLHPPPPTNQLPALPKLSRPCYLPIQRSLSLPLRASSFTRNLNTNARTTVWISQSQPRSMSTSPLAGGGLLHTLQRRPGAFEGMGIGSSRGMKVRSSVKKLCEGCKVRFFPPPPPPPAPFRTLPFYLFFERERL